MHFSNLDLNLLRVFLTLIDEGNATRAGHRLNLSPSAVSHALGRLRAALGDPLFIRGSTSLRPTPRALEMAPEIRRAMEQLQAAVSAPIFDPSSTEREFVTVVSAYGCSVLLPRIVRAFHQAAPRATLRVRAPEAGLAEALDEGRVDVVICSFERSPPRFAYTHLFEETAVWVVRGDHPATARGLSPGKLSRLPRVAVSALDPWSGKDDNLDGLGLTRPAGWSEDYMHGLAGMPAPPLMVPDVHSALAVVLETDMAALLPKRLALPAVQSGQLAMVEAAVVPAPARIGAIRLKAVGKNSPVAWFIELITSATAGL
ncbi:LysR family transcriptional regulator [Archangium violaceum]|uniref:LysR family transcriptional regulator n=1 Tax=Archangium violaceum TaxID=83451 RepID=UPI00193C2EA5|nr:LysR family transcriptional regulator [Archangium violaceum]QRK12521.1 LysR family transcriptional regulator [Archangium violaceum]